MMRGMGRPTSTLTKAQTERARRAFDDLDRDLARARDRCRARIQALVDAGASQAAIARAVGLTRSALGERLNPRARD